MADGFGTGVGLGEGVGLGVGLGVAVDVGVGVAAANDAVGKPTSTAAANATDTLQARILRQLKEPVVRPSTAG